LKTAALVTAIAIATSTISIPHIAFAGANGVKTTCGGASWYSLRSRTASGERMNPAAMTAAHKTLPLGSRVKVTNLSNNRSIVVTINDRGPFVKGRLIDLSKGAAQRLDFVSSGVARVQIAPADGSGAPSCA
jgi:rare lipoprotein A